MPINNISLFFSDATVDIAMPSPCTAFSYAISVKSFRWRTRSDRVTRNALAARNSAAYGQGNGRQSFPKSFAIIKNTGNGLVRLRLDCVQSRPPHRLPFSDFSEGRGRLYTGYLERIIPSSKVRRIADLKLKLFHFQIKTYYLSDANHQTDNPSHTNNASLV